MTICRREKGIAEDLTSMDEGDWLSSADWSCSRGIDILSSGRDFDAVIVIFSRGLNRFVAKKQIMVNGAMTKDSIKKAPRHPSELEFIFPPKTNPTAWPMGIAE